MQLGAVQHQTISSFVELSFFSLTQHQTCEHTAGTREKQNDNSTSTRQQEKVQATGMATERFSQLARVSKKRFRQLAWPLSGPPKEGVVDLIEQEFQFKTLMQ